MKQENAIIGAKVKRINTNNGNLKCGDIGIITKIDGSAAYVNNNHGLYHNLSNLELVTKTELPIFN